MIPLTFSFIIPQTSHTILLSVILSFPEKVVQIHVSLYLAIQNPIYKDS